MGLLQGDPESAKSFDSIVGSVLDQLESDWALRDYGFVLKESGVRFLSARLADNIFLFARAECELTIMLRELKVALHACNFQWKLSSLYSMSCGSMSTKVPNISLEMEEHSYNWVPVQALEALGARIDNRSTSNGLLHHRFCAAERLIWSKSKLFFSRAIPRYPKIKAWVRAVVPALMHSLRTIHLTKELLMATRRWENKWLSRILIIPWKTDEGVAGYRIRVSAIVADMFRRTSALRAHERIIACVFREACDDTRSAWAVRSDRDETWRTVIKSDSAKRRRQGDAMQARTGRRIDFESPFVSVAGPVWRPDLILMPLASFKHRRNNFIRRLCTTWGLPCTLSDSAAPGFQVEPTPGKVELRISPMTPIHEFTLPDLLGRDSYWCPDFNQLEFVTDNETLAAILNGSSLVQSNEHEQILRSCVNCLERLFADHFVPRYWVSPPVLWRPRRHNILADALANCAMNHKQDAVWESICLAGLCLYNWAQPVASSF